MKTAIITISALLAISGAASAYERCSDRTGNCYEFRQQVARQLRNDRVQAADAQPADRRSAGPLTARMRPDRTPADVPQIAGNLAARIDPPGRTSIRNTRTPHMLVLIRYLNSRRVRHQLHRLDDRMLKDIGLGRADIERIATCKPAGPYAIRENIRWL